MKSNWKNGFLIFMKGWGYSIIIALIIATSFKSAIAEMNLVPTGSMKPTIVEGDRIFVNKLAYDLKVPYTTIHIAKWSDPQRGDIVVLFSPVDGMRLVKRVVGIPGDIIEMRNNQLIVNGEKVKYELVEQPGINNISRLNATQYTYIEDLNNKKHPVLITPGHQSRHASFKPVTVPADKYLLMGDNRDDSTDSRVFGFADRDSIVGEATSVVFSFDIFNNYKPRWKRFFTKCP